MRYRQLLLFLVFKQFLRSQQEEQRSSSFQGEEEILPEDVFDLLLASARKEDYLGGCPLSFHLGQGIINPQAALDMARIKRE